MSESVRRQSVAKRWRWRVLAIAIGLVLPTVSGLAGPLAGQAPPPDGQWRTLRTEHFRVTFQPDLEPLARHAAEVAERTHAILVEELAPAPAGPIELVVTDHVDLTNGSATPFTSNRIVVFARPPLDVPQLAYSRDWIELVVAHEIVHIFHLDDTGPVGRVLRGVFGRLPLLWPVFPAAGTPGWNVEGLATHYESRLTGAGRVHGSFHDMVIRTAALESELPDLDDVSTASPVWPAGQRSYVYGAALMRWLAEREGDDVHRRLIDATGGSLLPTFLFFDGVAEGPTGQDFEEHYDEWRAATRSAAEQLHARLAADGLTPSETLVDVGPYAVHPRSSPDGRWISYGAWDYRSDPATRLYDTATGDVRSLARRNQYGPVLGPAAWLPDGSGLVVAQLEYRGPYRLFSDLYRIDAADGDETRLTRGARLSHPDVSPDGRTVVAVANDHGALALVLYDLDTGVARTLADARPGDGFGAPRFSPDGRTIAATRFADGAVDVVLVDAVTGQVRALTYDDALDGGPAWSPDGRWVLFWSDRSGVPNLYAVAPDDVRTLRQVTSVATGAFDPDVSPDGRWIHFTRYHHDGWHLERVPYDPEGWRDPPSSVMHHGDALLPAPAEPMTGGGPETREYTALASVRPYFWLPYYDETAFLQDRLRFWGIQTTGWDVLQRHSYSALVAWDFGTGRPMASLDWAYAGLGDPVVGLTAARDWSTAGSIRLPDNSIEAVYLREDEVGLDLTFRRQRWRTSSSLTVGGDHVWREYEAHEPDPLLLREANDALNDVYGAFVAPAFANYRVHPYSISREDGVSASFLARRWWADTGGREYDQLHGRLAAYLGIPLWGFADHVLAGRVSGLLRTGPRAVGTAIGGAAGAAQDLLVTDFGGETLLLPVRGFDQGIRRGTRAWTASAELRLPLYLRGLPTSVLGLSPTALSAALFADAGDAWCPADDISAGISSCDIESRPIVLSAGAELNFDIGVLSGVPLRLRAGAAVPLRGAADHEPVVYFRLGPSF